MKRQKIKFFLILILLSACKLEGVENDFNSDNDSINPLIDSTLIEIAEVDPLILPDSVNGIQNERVWMNDEGLRVEWTIKKDNPIQLNDVVLVNYKARVASGEEYDNNDKIGFPVPLKTNIGMMVPGWEKGLLQMNIGDVGRIMIPSALAYGENGYLTIVPPDADLIIDIEIIERVKPKVLEEGVKVYIWDNAETGIFPKKNQTITFDYFAYTTGDKAMMYDNSYKNGEPFTVKFENDNVVDGLHQGLGQLGPGDKAYIEIPAKLGYGKTGLQDLVPKNTAIVYDVRVLDIR